MTNILEAATLARASDAWFIDSNGLLVQVAPDVKRFPSGLLREKVATNLFPYSEDFAQSEWIKTRIALVENAATAPNGLLEMTKLEEDNTDGGHQLSDAMTLDAATTYTVSCFVRAGERNLVRMRHTSVDMAESASVYDLANGTVTAASATTTARIEDLGGGIYRVFNTFTTVTGGYSVLRLQLHDGSSASYVGTAGSGAYFWGAQIEEGPIGTSYIASEGSATTRDDDLTRETLDTPITNNVSGTIKFRPQFNDSDDKGSNARIFSIQGANVGTDALELACTQSSGVLTLVKDADNNSASVSSTESYSRDDLITVDFYANSTGIGWRRDGGAWNVIETANAQADWSTDPIYQLAIGSRYSGSHGANIIIEEFTLTSGSQSVVTFGYSPDVGHIQAVPQLGDGDTIEYDPWLYEADGVDLAPYEGFAEIRQDGSICVPASVSPGIYQLKNVRARISGIWSAVQTYILNVRDAAALASQKMPVLVTKRSDGRWLSG